MPQPDQVSQGADLPVKGGVSWGNSLHSGQLYVHRNTLVYRFEKIQKKFGLDLRTFEDALTFKLAMLVAGYVTYTKNQR